MLYSTSSRLYNRRNQFLNNITEVVISSSTNNINLFSLAGSPNYSKTWYFKINSGVLIGSTSNSIPSIRTGIFPVGSIIRLVNQGTIDSKEGIVGNINGGDAILLEYNLQLDNTFGNIFSGGGCGGTGGRAQYAIAFNDGYYDGEGNWHDGYYTYDYAAGGAGGPGKGTENRSGPSLGSPGTHYSPTGYSGAGGDGGDYGSNGQPGADNSELGQAGGLAGKAINLNGNSITWFGGNNGTQVKGSVS